MTETQQRTTYRGRDGTTVRIWPREDGRIAFQVLLPDGAGGTSGSGATRADAERMAAEAARGGE